MLLYGNMVYIGRILKRWDELARQGSTRLHRMYPTLRNHGGDKILEGKWAKEIL